MMSDERGPTNGGDQPGPSNGGDQPGPSNEPSSRSVYMMTYSKADVVKVATKECFIKIVCEAFHKSGTAKIVQYTCSREEHKDGTPHYHMVVKLDKQKRWRCVRKYMDSKYGIQVNFTNVYTNYYDAYQYIRKTDMYPVLSENHPDLTNPYRTTTATQARRQGHTRTRKRCFDALDLSEVIEKHNIRDKIELLNLAKKQKNEGKRDLSLYVLNNIDKCVKIIETTWEMNRSDNILSRRTSPRMEILSRALEEECAEWCQGRWLNLAKETLCNNGINIRDFAGAMCEAIENGRGKRRNVLLYGEGNCGKTFLLKPLCSIYQTFSNPAKGTFAWLGVENAEIIFLNDFRWDEKYIAWADFLKLLEGDFIHFPAPKTSYAKDIFLQNDTPIFATSIDVFKKSLNATKENKMMALRWTSFQFHYEIDDKDIIRIDACPHCFAELIINN